MRHCDMEKIAIASSDGIRIDTHFGRAEHFYIYNIGDDGGISPEQRRAIPPAQAEDGEYDRLKTIALLLSDVTYVLCLHIGKNGIDVLRRHGITGYAVSGSIQQVLNKYSKRRRLAQNILACTGPNFECDGIGHCADRRCIKDDCH